MPALRDYQSSCVSSIKQEWETVISTLAVLPTGSGKSAIAATVINDIQPKRAMFVAHREELIWQFRDTLKKFTGLEAGIEMGELQCNRHLFGEPPVVIATVQTLNSKWGERSRMGKFNPMDFGVLVIDEFHHGVAQTYRNVINYFCQNKDLRVCGLTATPDRADEEALGQIIDSVAFDYEILDAIHDGWLVPIDQQFVSIAGLDFSQIRTTAGDLNGADLNAIMEAESNMQGVAGAAIEIIGNRRTIVFTASVKQAEVVCNILNRHRNGMAEWVCGMTNRDVRRETLSRFESGATQVVCNCGVLTEGFDNPGVEVIVMARPTKSRSLYAQMAGRSTRPLPGLVDGVETADARKEAIRASAKPSCLIVDFVGNSGRHKLMSSADILGGKVSDAAIERAILKAKQSAVRVDMTKELEEAEAELQRELLERKQQEEARKARLVAKVKYQTRVINPFDAFELHPVKARGWDQGKTLSEKQKALLLKQGLDPDAMSYAQGRQLIQEMFRRWNKHLCTVKQASLLKRFGYETHDLTFDAASALIDRLAKNNWRKA